ncbi:MAG: TetR/AcrR family transcriptional regulator [Azospirillum brasilense]|uniref:TetR/AcrR family transcriptional regulator n=1 Tax=Roseomonas mucosa TaxID=207340 RepID=UPI000DAFCCC5|nr:TetR/AcrR family transcriptional regulator [Roseomonas mucosa]PZP39712.1 MAG: TetR/AcrR family transcriptional regulator [Azospirillum brasilense]QDD96953.1 Transcriptional regulator, TetR family [Roseomonas mucosa]
MSYHHGDLRRALVDAALAIVAETDRWDLSLREVARRAGVSHNAPYAHFPDKGALLAAVGVRVYERLRGATTAAAVGCRTAEEALVAIGRAYIAFGTENVALYRLMSGQGLSVDGRLPEPVREAAEAARGVLREIIAEGAREGSFDLDPNDAEEVAAAVVSAWSVVHGFTLLAIDGLASRETDIATARLADMTLRRFMRGLTRRVA